MMLKKLLLPSVGVLVLTLLCALTFTNAPSAQAITRPTNSGVFAGRFIPAFLGAAYDPSSAYSEMAGLPVYVVAFDFWDDPTRVPLGETTWIVSDLAVKTQIRADGTFQVQGLPEASHYGVYFPYSLNPATNLVQRTDCTANRDDFNANADNPCQPEFANKTIPFRMPRPEDKLVDVFSYAATYLADETGADISAGGIPTLDTQNQLTPPPTPTYERIRLEHVFITNRNELDIDNNINTFPLVPNTTLRVTTRLTDVAGTSLEVSAMRISQTRHFNVPGPAGSVLSGPINYPIVAGRAIRGQEGLGASNAQADYIFQAYAPPGNYVVIVWRKEQNSPTYNEWDTRAALNSHLSGWAHMSVGDSVTHPTTPSNNADWRQVLSSTDFIRPVLNQLIVWGTITDANGILLTNAAFPAISLNAQVNVWSNLERPYVTSPVTSQTATFVSPQIDTGTATVDATATAQSIRGVYAVMMDRSGLASGSTTATSDKVTVALDQAAAANYNRSATSTPIIHSSAGPFRNDITAVSSDGGIANGYDTGLFIRATDPLDGNGPASGASVTIIENQEGLSVNASSKVYYLNRLGEGHIPLGDLTPLDGAEPSTAQFILSVRLPGAAVFREFQLDANGFASITDAQMQTIAKQGSDSDYNFALLDTISDFIHDRKNDFTAYAQAQTARAVKVNLSLPEDGNEVNGNVEVSVLYGNSGEECTRCDIFEAGTTTPYNGDYTRAPLDVFLVPPEDTEELRTYCETATGPAWWWHCSDLPELADQAETYRILAQTEIDGKVLSAESSVSVNANRTEFSPPSVDLNLSQNCDSLRQQIQDEGFSLTGLVTGDSSFLDFGSQIVGLVAKGACETGNFMMQHLPGVLSMIYKYGLQTRALNQDQPVIELFDITRNVVNVLFVLIFVIIGIMTILRYQPEQWHLSVLLPRLISGIFLANFSLVIVQAMLDLNNFATFVLFEFTLSIVTGLLTPEGTAITGATVTAVLSAAMFNVGAGLFALIASAVATGGLSLIPIAIAVVGFVVMILVQVLTLLVLFFSRYLVIWLAVVAAPLVFGLGVLPWFRSITSRWWKAVIGISFVQTAVAGILSIGILLLTVGGSNYSLFAGFGTAIVGIIAFIGANKVAGAMIGGAAAVAGVGLSAGMISGKLSSLAGNAVQGSMQRMGNIGQNREDDRKQAAERRGRAEARVEKKGGSARRQRFAGAASSAMFRATQSVPGARQLRNYNAANAAKKKERQGLQDAAYFKEAVGFQPSPAQLAQFKEVYDSYGSEFKDDDYLYDMQGNAVTDSNGKHRQFGGLINQNGQKRNGVQFAVEMSRLNRSSQLWLRTKSQGKNVPTGASNLGGGSSTNGSGNLTRNNMAQTMANMPANRGGTPAPKAEEKKSDPEVNKAANATPEENKKDSGRITDQYNWG